MNYDETYDEAVREDIYEACGRNRKLAAAVLNTLPRSLLLTEDGRFVKVEPVAGWDVNPKGEGPVRIFYRIVEDPTQ